MARPTLWLSVVALALMPMQTVSAKASRAHSAGQTIVIYTGTVDASSAERLTTLIEGNIDKIIGLKLAVVESRDSDARYYSALSDNQLNITSGDPMDAPTEVVINGGIGTTGAGAFYTVDGFYLIKSGGSHAGGAVSVGAVPVNEATIRLNPRIRLITKPF